MSMSSQGVYTPRLTNFPLGETGSGSSIRARSGRRSRRAVSPPTPPMLQLTQPSPVNDSPFRLIEPTSPPASAVGLMTGVRGSGGAALSMYSNDRSLNTMSSTSNSHASREYPSSVYTHEEVPEPSESDAPFLAQPHSLLDAAPNLENHPYALVQPQAV
jgi:hypothetical protein